MFDKWVKETTGLLLFSFTDLNTRVATMIQMEFRFYISTLILILNYTEFLWPF